MSGGIFNLLLLFLLNYSISHTATHLNTDKDWVHKQGEKINKMSKRTNKRSFSYDFSSKISTFLMTRVPLERSFRKRLFRGFDGDDTQTVGAFIKKYPIESTLYMFSEHLNIPTSIDGTSQLRSEYCWHSIFRIL